MDSLHSDSPYQLKPEVLGVTMLGLRCRRAAKLLLILKSWALWAYVLGMARLVALPLA